MLFVGEAAIDVEGTPDVAEARVQPNLAGAFSAFASIENSSLYATSSLGFTVAPRNDQVHLRVLLRMIKSPEFRPCPFFFGCSVYRSVS